MNKNSNLVQLTRHLYEPNICSENNGTLQMAFFVLFYYCSDVKLTSYSFGDVLLAINYGDSSQVTTGVIPSVMCCRSIPRCLITRANESPYTLLLSIIYSYADMNASIGGKANLTS